MLKKRWLKKLMVNSLEELGDMIVTEDIGHYDCHIPDKIIILYKI